MGQFSKVYSGIERKTNMPCAIKVVNKAMLNDVEREMLRSEIKIVALIEHPNIVHFSNVIQSADYAYIISELMTGGDLYQYMDKHTRLSENQAALVIYYLLESIKYLHECGIVHRDIKPDNILVETVDDGEDEQIVNIKLIDFGLSKVILPDQQLIDQCGTLSYVAPEVLLHYGYGKEVDLWSVGIIMHFMYFSTYYINRLSGKLPFDSRDRMSIVEQTLNSRVNLNDKCWNLISPSGTFCNSI